MIRLDLIRFNAEQNNKRAVHDGAIKRQKASHELLLNKKKVERITFISTRGNIYVHIVRNLNLQCHVDAVEQITFISALC